MAIRDRVHATLLTYEAGKACWTGGMRPAEGALRIISGSLVFKTLKLPASCDSHVTFRNTQSSSLSRQYSSRENTKDFFRGDSAQGDVSDSFYRNFIRRFLNVCTLRKSKELRDLSSVVYYKYKKRVKRRRWLTKCHDKSRNHHYIASFIKDTRILKTRHFSAE